MNSSGIITQQRKAAERSAPGTQLHPQLVGISYVVDDASPRPAAMGAPGLFLAHFPEALMESGAFAQWHRGCPLPLSTIPHAGRIGLEKQRSAPGNVCHVLCTVILCKSVLILQPM